MGRRCVCAGTGRLHPCQLANGGRAGVPGYRGRGRRRGPDGGNRPWRKPGSGGQAARRPGPTPGCRRRAWPSAPGARRAARSVRRCSACSGAPHARALGHSGTRAVGTRALGHSAARTLALVGLDVGRGPRRRACVPTCWQQAAALRPRAVPQPPLYSATAPGGRVHTWRRARNAHHTGGSAECECVCVRVWVCVRVQGRRWTGGPVGALCQRVSLSAARVLPSASGGRWGVHVWAPGRRAGESMRWEPGGSMDVAARGHVCCARCAGGATRGATGVHAGACRRARSVLTCVLSFPRAARRPRRPPPGFAHLCHVSAPTHGPRAHLGGARRRLERPGRSSGTLRPRRTALLSCRGPPGGHQRASGLGDSRDRRATRPRGPAIHGSSGRQS